MSTDGSRRDAGWILGRVLRDTAPNTFPLALLGRYATEQEARAALEEHRATGTPDTAGLIVVPLTPLTVAEVRPWS